MTRPGTGIMMRKRDGGAELGPTDQTTPQDQEIVNRISVAVRVRRAAPCPVPRRPRRARTDVTGVRHRTRVAGCGTS